MNNIEDMMRSAKPDILEKALGERLDALENVVVHSLAALVEAMPDGHAREALVTAYRKNVALGTHKPIGQICSDIITALSGLQAAGRTDAAP